MQTLAEILAGLPSTEQSFDMAEYEQRRIDWHNANAGVLTGYDCPDCLNRGSIAVMGEGGRMALQSCKCVTVRRAVRRIEKSGLKHLLEEYTFDRYQARDAWQAHAKQAAQAFLQDYHGNWFFAGGQVGAGKTHLCTAIVGEFLKRGKSARYMLWRDDVVSLKASVTDDEAYSTAMRGFKQADVLYIDDFFKTERGKNPTGGDINIAFELLNYRYNNRDLVTIISSERSVDDILDIDEAVGSRIYQRSKGYCLVIGADKRKNWRLGGTHDGA